MRNTSAFSRVKHPGLTIRGLLDTPPRYQYFCWSYSVLDSSFRIQSPIHHRNSSMAVWNFVAERSYNLGLSPVSSTAVELLSVLASVALPSC